MAVWHRVEAPKQYHLSLLANSRVFFLLLDYLTGLNRRVSMRFNLVTLLLASAAGNFIATDHSKQIDPYLSSSECQRTITSDLDIRSLITDVGSVVSELENGLGVTEIENQLDALLGNPLTKVSFTLRVVIIRTNHLIIY